MAIVNSSDVLLLQEDNSLYDPEPSENPRKRKRIPIACDACRARKSRCDGGRPKCSGCVMQEVGCVYATHPSTASTAAGLCKLSPKARLLAIERDIREIKKTRRPAPSPTAPPAADREDERTEDEAGAGISPGLTDGVGTIEFAIQQTPAFFGPSSNIAFTRLVRRSIFTKLYGPEPIPRRERHVNFPFHRQDQLVISRPSTPDPFKPPKTWPSASAPTAVQLPPEDEVIRLVKVFFSDTAILFPYIHEESFWETFKSAARSNFRHVGSPWLGLLYMILAMAISTTPDATGSNQPASNSDRYFVCAQSLCLNRREVDASLEASKSQQPPFLLTQNSESFTPWVNQVNQYK
ncbi:hypothetical protein TCE0_034r11389 [Talaromyces pinophilus]|uniref:Zn(2)-C6 fungal-type domain-containing protein n=1 Tax=Talaromyces pinophilus TaxID=128442 RepID=A0A6V8HE96_TALPI|nr:hypothetical protein TCE0_034r11389 [Talaromyces pinophilus]